MSKKPHACFTDRCVVFRSVKACISSRRSRAYHQRKALHLINSAGIVSHQHEVLYIIKPQKKYTPYGVMRYKGGKPPLMIYRLTADDIPREALNKSSSAEQRIFCPIRAVRKTGNTSSIPVFFELSPVTKSLAVSSCRFNQSFPSLRLG